MAYKEQFQAGSNMVLIVCIIIVMIVFGIIMSHSINEIALQPLESMLSTVRSRCSEIFKYTGALQSTGEEDDNQDHDDEDYDDVEHSSEFVLLEMVVEKLATIVQLTTASRNEDVEEMTEHDQHAHNWLQGAGVKASRIAKFTRAKSKLKDDPSAGPDMKS